MSSDASKVRAASDNTLDLATKTAHLGQKPGVVTAKSSECLHKKNEDIEAVEGEVVERGCDGGGKEVSELQKGRRASRKLDENAFKPWGGCAMSRSSSDTGSSGNETFFCKGGPGRESCGDPVLDGEMGMRCDWCLAWFHASCQGIVEEAFEAIEMWHPVLSWLCSECKVRLRNQSSPSSSDCNKLGDIETKVDQLQDFMRTHIRTVERCLKEQEKASVEQGKLLERAIRENHQEKASYADMVKGSCKEVVTKVTSHIASLPVDNASRATTKTVQDLSVMFDDYQDKEKRKLNVVVHNMMESDSNVFEERAKHDAYCFEKMVREAFSLKVTCVRSFRAGKKMPGKDRLLIVSLESIGIRQELLRLAPQLRSCEAYNRIYINPDLTPREREQGRKLREELAARKERGEKSLVIRKGKIVSLTDTPGPNGRAVHSVDAEEQKRDDKGSDGNVALDHGTNDDKLNHRETQGNQ